MTTGHTNQGKSSHAKNRGQGKKKKKGVPRGTRDPIKNGVRVGYHSEAANPPKFKDTPSGEGMKIGYHSEAANVGETKDGMRVGYHSERANPPKPDQKEGMKIGYHSEAANPPKEREEGGMNIGYHSEAANIGSHSKRLHRDRVTEEGAKDENGTTNQ